MTGDPPNLDFDYPCVQCAYNLRGLPADGRCPECGASVARTNHVNRLRAAAKGSRLRGPLPSLRESEAAWVRTVRDGLVMMLVAAAAGAAMQALLAARLPWNQAPHTAIRILAATAWGVGAVGWWKVAAPEPFERTRPGKWVARGLGVAYAAVVLPISIQPDGWRAVLFFGSLLAGLALAAVTYARLAWLARREGCTFLAVLLGAWAVVAPIAYVIRLMPQLGGSGTPYGGPLGTATFAPTPGTMLPPEPAVLTPFAAATIAALTVVVARSLRDRPRPAPGGQR